jgi:glycosyltransferase involved in cell wall biosynthesis
MKVSGFTFCRNAVRYDYPVVESIRSILPIVDEFIVNVGRCDDGTLELIKSIGDHKIRIVESVWDEQLKKDGLIYSQQTNIALSRCTGDWALYLQADEVIHERDFETILRSLRREVGNPAVLGFTFRYLHFYGDYGSCNPWFYHRAVRAIRNDGQVESCGDAVGFSLKADGGFLQSVHKDRVRPSGATIYHYGYVKSARVLLEKVRRQVPVYHGDHPNEELRRLLEKEAYGFEDYNIMKNFSGSHPAVMQERVSGYALLRPRRNRWLNLAFYAAVLRRGFRG